MTIYKPEFLRNNTLVNFHLLGLTQSKYSLAISAELKAAVSMCDFVHPNRGSLFHSSQQVLNGELQYDNCNL